jgi:hypothetical protein
MQIMEISRRVLPFVAGLLLFTALPSHSQAQNYEVCFVETGYCISNRVRQFWEQNGGLPVFGYPVSPLVQETNPATGLPVLVQWFERHRFEVHPENAPPYDVLLGRIGSERLRAQGIDWQARPAAAPVPDCLWFPQSRHNLCDQVPGLGFKSYWESNGLLDPALNSYEQSLALFGMPLTEAYWETSASGQRIMVQWFERARFEWHPTNPPPFNILLGLLGTEHLESLPLSRFINGVWEGFTSQRRTLFMTIESGTIQTIVTDVTIEGEGCSQTLRYVQSEFDADGLVPVAGNSFSAAIEENDMLFTISGTFESDTIASGTLQLVTRPGIPFTCVGSGAATWNIERQVAPPPVSPPPPGPPQPQPTTLPDTGVPGGPSRPPSNPSPALCQQQPDPTTAPNAPITLVDVDKKAEVVTLENVGDEIIDLTDWTLCSLTGQQVHTGISGAIAPGQVRRLINLGPEVWLNDGRDDGALYDGAGNLVSYWEDPLN